MDCITPSHPEKIPHGESLDINQLLEKGEEAFLDPETVPKEGPIDLERFTYTPRQSVMSTLDSVSGSDITYIKAQITTDDKELKALVKEVEAGSTSSEKTSTANTSKSGTGTKGSSGSNSGLGAPRGRRPKPKVPIPPHAQPQRAMLMEVEDRWSMGYKKAFGGNKPWLPQKKSEPNWNQNRSWISDGWEV